MGTYKITANGITESHLDTIEAATRRVKMLRKRSPWITYEVHMKLPKVTVTRIAENDPTAAHIVRSGAPTGNLKAVA